MEPVKTKQEPGSEKSTQSKETSILKAITTPLNVSAHSSRNGSTSKNQGCFKHTTPKTPYVNKIEPNTDAPQVNKVMQKEAAVISAPKPLTNMVSTSADDNKGMDVKGDSGDKGSSVFVYAGSKPNTAVTARKPVSSTAGASSVRSNNKNENNNSYQNNVASSRNSSPFTVNVRAETAGTNFSHISTSRDATGGDTSKHMSKMSTDVLDSTTVLREIGDVNLSVEEDYYGFQDSSPSVNRKGMNKRSQEEEEDINVKRQKLNSILMELTEKEDKFNDSFDSDKATNGSDSGITRPDKYVIDNKAVYEYIEGEEEKYYDIMGKTNRFEELNENEKEFIVDVGLKFNDWITKSKEFNKKYGKLCEEAILARMRFDKRFQFIINNLDEFSIQLEKCGDGIQKRSNILKEYCSKIVKEIE